MASDAVSITGVEAEIQAGIMNTEVRGMMADNGMLPQQTSSTSTSGAAVPPVTAPPPSTGSSTASPSHDLVATWSTLEDAKVWAGFGNKEEAFLSFLEHLDLDTSTPLSELGSASKSEFEEMVDSWQLNSKPHPLASNSRQNDLVTRREFMPEQN